MTFWCTGASLVAIKRVPMFMPAAPIASAATRLRASAMPPEATNGIFNSSAARGNRIMLGMSSSPGWPPHSKPSTLTASQPILLGLQRMPDGRTFVDYLDAAAFKAGIYCSGLRPAVSTILTPPSLMAAMYSGYGGAVKVGRKGKVHTERLVRHVAAARDLLGEQFRRSSASGR